MKFYSKTILIFLSLTLQFAYAQEKNKITDFEQKLNVFRFSLNKELDKVSDDKITDFSFNSNDSITIVVDDFLTKNQKEIEAYRTYLLEQYMAYPSVDFDLYTPLETNATEIIHSLNTVSNSLFKLVNINPINEVDLCKTLYFSKEKKVSELAKHKLRESITSHLIKTRKIDSNQWEIIENSYNMVGKYIYDIKKGKVIDFQLFERKEKKQ